MKNHLSEGTYHFCPHLSRYLHLNGTGSFQVLWRRHSETHVRCRCQPTLRHFTEQNGHVRPANSQGVGQTPPAASDGESWRKKRHAASRRLYHRRKHGTGRPMTKQLMTCSYSGTKKTITSAWVREISTAAPRCGPVYCLLNLGNELRESHDAPWHGGTVAELCLSNAHT
jgi:hypothetical protein